MTGEILLLLLPAVFISLALPFGEEALVAVRGQHVSACAVFRGDGANAMRRDLLRFVREFEGQNYGQLTTWEEAARIVGAAADAPASLLSGTRNSSSTPAPRTAQS